MDIREAAFSFRGLSDKSKGVPKEGKYIGADTLAAFPATINTGGKEVIQWRFLHFNFLQW